MQAAYKDCHQYPCMITHEMRVSSENEITRRYRRRVKYLCYYSEYEVNVSIFCLPRYEMQWVMDSLEQDTPWLCTTDSILYIVFFN